MMFFWQLCSGAYEVKFVIAKNEGGLIKTVGRMFYLAEKLK